MDRNRFDRLTRLFATTGSRRRAVSALISAAILGHDADILARKRNGKDDKDKGKNGPGHGKSGKGKGRGRGKHGQHEGHNKNDRAVDEPASDPALADPAAADAASGAAPQHTSGDGKGGGKRRKHGKGGNNKKKNKDKDRNTQPTDHPVGSEPGSGSSEAATEDASALTIEAMAQAESCWRAGACTVKKGANVSQCNLAGYTAPDLLDCTGCNLSRANLRGADLTGVNFTRANLSYACLIDADFTGAAFAPTTNLANAIFCNTIMPDGSVNTSGCASGTACCSTCTTGLKQCGNACIANDQCCTNGSAACAQSQTCCSGSCQDCCGSDTSTCPAVPPGATCKAPSCQNGTCGLVNGPNGQTGNNCASPRFCQDGVCVGCVTPATCPPAPTCKVATCNGGECGTANQEDGATCSLSGGGQGVCSNGECVQCISPGTCPAAPICQVATCNGSQCGTANATNGPAPGCPDPGCCNGSCCTSGQVCAGSRCCPTQTPVDCGGTCTNTNSDLNNCGACGRVCSFPHASANCVAGACELGACDQGFANCDGDPATGCETPLGADQNCSGCGNVCSGGTVCQNFTCVTPCEVCANGCRYTTVQAAISDFTGPTTIRICPGTYEQFIVSRDVTLIGAGQGDNPASNTIINAAGGALPGTIFVNLGRSVSLQRLRITGGKIGVIFWGGSLGMTDCTVTGNNNLSAGGLGSGVSVLVDFNPGSAHLTNCTISGNTTGGSGGGIYVDEGASVTVNGGTVTGNRANGAGGGGGIYNNQGSVTLSNGASVTGNTPNNCAGFPAVPGCVG